MNFSNLFTIYLSGSAGKEYTCNAGDLGSIPGLGRSSGEGNATHPSILAGIIPWTKEPGGLQSVGFQIPSRPRDRTRVSCLEGRFFTNWATREATASKELEQKLGVRAKAGYCTWTLHSTLQRKWANHLCHHSSPTTEHTPILTPYKEKACLPSGSQQTKKSNLLLLIPPHHCRRGPNKALSEYLVSLLVNFYWLVVVVQLGLSC